MEYNYPTIEQDEFYNKIYNKKEFKQHALIPDNRTPEQMCNQKSFGLFQHQILLRNYLSPNTHYDGVLLFHDVGVGKTCAAITIAESHKLISKSYNKKIIVLLDKSIKSNFTNTIHKIVKNQKDENQCTGVEYKNYDIYDTLETKIKKKDKLIKQFYNIFTYGKFTNFIIKNKYNGKLLKKLFSNTVIIVDEVHNLREHDTNDIKRYDALKIALYHAQKSKLVLLSATPMFDQPQEIVSITNLFLLNKTNKKLSSSKIFENNKFTKIGIELYEKNKDKVDKILKNPNYINKNIQPYILDIFTIYKETLKENDIFSKNGTLIKPDILKKNLKGYVSFVRGDNPKTFPKKNFQGTDLKLFDLIKVVPSIMSQQHQNVYMKEINKKTTNLNKIRQLSNVNFVDEINFEKIDESSSKFKRIINIAINSPGIVFIYSEFIENSLDILEQLFKKNKYSKFNMNNPIKKKSYTYLTGNSSINERNNVLDVINSKKNKNGEIIKIILGSKIFKEGISMKNVRQIHIVEPWHNLSRIEQVIGRGVRNCSHIMLPPSSRFVDIFLHVSLFDNKALIFNKNLSFTEVKNKIPYDVYAYVNSEMKQKKINHVARLLRTIAFDCKLHEKYNQNKNDNIVCVGNFKNQPDNSTYQSFMDKPMIDYVISVAKRIFSKQYYLTFDLIKNTIKRSDVTDEIINKSLFELKKYTFFDVLNRKSYVIRRDNFYVLQPFSEKNENISMYERMKPIKQNKKVSLVDFFKKEHVIVKGDEVKKMRKKKLITKDVKIIDKKIINNYEISLKSDGSIVIRNMIQDKNVDKRKKISGKQCMNFNGQEMNDVSKNLNIDISKYLKNGRIIRGKKKEICNIIKKHFFS